jgi:hypothetical protein
VKGTATGFSRSTNRGAAFTDRGAITAPSSGDPVLTVNNAGHFLLAHMADTNNNFWIDQIVVDTSTDGCQTFGGRSVVDSVVYPTSVDKPWIAADRTNSPFKNNVYVCWTEFPGAGGARINVRRQFPAQGAITRVDSAAANNAPQGCQVAVGKDGIVYAAWEEQAAAGQIPEIWMTKSVDGGDNFQR